MLALGPDRQVWFPCGQAERWGVGDMEGLLALSIYPSVHLSVCLSVWWDLKPCSRDHDDQVWVALCLAMGLCDNCMQ